MLSATLLVCHDCLVLHICLISDSIFGDECKFSRVKGDWTLCCFCQTETSEKLQHPYEKVCYHEAYESIEEGIDNFIDNNVALPAGMAREWCLLTEGENRVSKSLLSNKAVYHKACRDKVRIRVVDRQLKRRTKELHL